MPLRISQSADPHSTTPWLVVHHFDGSNSPLLVARFRRERDAKEFTSTRNELEDLKRRVQELETGRPCTVPAPAPLLPESPITPVGVDVSAMNLDELIKLAIESTVVRCGGDRAASIRSLGISARCLFEHLKQYGWAPRACAPPTMEGGKCCPICNRVFNKSRRLQPGQDYCTRCHRRAIHGDSESNLPEPSEEMVPC